MSVLVMGKYKDRVLEVMNIQCKCGNVYSVNSFNNTGTCPDCFKKQKEEADGKL